VGWRTNTGNNDDGNGRHGEQKRMIDGKDSREKQQTDVNGTISRGDIGN
jgi:hypothetical protein